MKKITFLFFMTEISYIWFDFLNIELMKEIIEAYKKGYRITENGSITNPEGEEIAGYVKEGYRVFSIRIQNKVRTIKVHRLQAFQKYGEAMFESGVVVRHLNSNSEDNTWENILIGSQSDNMMDVPEAIRIAKALHATSFVKKHNHEEIAQYHNTHGKSYKKTMEHFAISSKGTLNFILRKSNPQRESNPQPSPS